MPRLLFYGGSFNPPHKGHERILECAIDEIKPDLTLVIPTGVSPHKLRSTTPFWSRYEMCSCFRKLDKSVRISSIENVGHKCYTFETLKRLKKRYPDHDIYMLIGSDMVTSFHKWHLYRRIMSMCTIVAGCRDDDDMQDYLEAAERLKKEGGKFHLLRYEPYEVSSTQVREGLKNGTDVSDFLSEEVLSVIKRKGLYR